MMVPTTTSVTYQQQYEIGQNPGTVQGATSCRNNEPGPRRESLLGETALETERERRRHNFGRARYCENVAAVPSVLSLA